MQNATFEAAHPTAATLTPQGGPSEPLVMVIQEECASLFTVDPDPDHWPPLKGLRDLLELGRSQQMHLVPCATTTEAISDVIEQYLDEVTARRARL